MRNLMINQWIMGGYPILRQTAGYPHVFCCGSRGMLGMSMFLFVVSGPGKSVSRGWGLRFFTKPVVLVTCRICSGNLACLGGAINNSPSVSQHPTIDVMIFPAFCVKVLCTLLQPCVGGSTYVRSSSHCFLIPPLPCCSRSFCDHPRFFHPRSTELLELAFVSCSISVKFM